jgi:hypothetical protein
MASAAATLLHRADMSAAGHRVEMAGPYVLGRTIARGTTCKVKAGYHKSTKMPVRAGSVAPRAARRVPASPPPPSARHRRHRRHRLSHLLHFVIILSRALV